MQSELSAEMFVKKTVRFLFCAFFIFWIVLAGLELLMPGFAIYYLNMNQLLAIVILFGVIDAIL
ncbi:MAG: hypothetical protein V1763_02920 [Parcubacteria group bacterium]